MRDRAAELMLAACEESGVLADFVAVLEIERHLGERIFPAAEVVAEPAYSANPRLGVALRASFRADVTVRRVSALLCRWKDRPLAFLAVEVPTKDEMGLCYRIRRHAQDHVGGEVGDDASSTSTQDVMNHLAAVSELLKGYAKKFPQLTAKAAVGESDLGDAIGDFRREDVSPTLKTASVIDFLLAHGATPVSPMVRMLVMGQPAVPAWRGNGQAIRLSKIDLTGTFLPVYTIGALAVVTNDTLVDTSDATKAALTTNLTDAIDGGVNSVAMDPTNAGVVGALPPAITYDATTIHSAGATILNIATDFNAGLRELSDKGSDLRNVVAVVHSRTAANLATMRTAEGGAPFPGMTPSGGQMFGVPTFASAAVPNGGSPTDTTVTLMDATDLCVADLGARPSLSNETMLEMSDAPTGATTTPAAATATRVSMFQAEATAVKVIRHVGWALRRGLVVVIDGVDY